MGRKLVFGSLAMAAVALVSGTASGQTEATAQAGLSDRAGKRVGEAVLTQMDHGVLIRLELTGLPPGWHGLHIHEAGRCEPPFASAGGHFNPDRKRHGLVREGVHSGDLPNVYVGPDGAGKAEMVSDRIALSGEAPRNILAGAGVSILVHAGPDDYKSDPAGNSGDRIACGIIQRR